MQDRAHDDASAHIAFRLPSADMRAFNLLAAKQKEAQASVSFGEFQY
jgi:hypothetical protein